ncbi:metallophosphoesterase [Paracidovorax avenae ATCC 19860]|uniref:Metallophosphoesterase n=1 Tax=Paracidovorax avenae (strain ATCC 19860 / DSM 7227 / CCUG 15838 / JCM 20985 / LMG 2117 / NCPPB 1011) TaxID=643561 RepID=F0QAK2_PARA1|nr:metallophosphoesterase [Paracidovorax avenae]ADX46043.1 metallophosphoesterase [Paracidovorax avenae ATCC 19860]AVS67712.1 metallophosphoesterase [Paracidovorax avenae]
MKLLVLSDLHADRSAFRWPDNVDFDVAIVAGDILSPGRESVDWLLQCAAASGRPVVFVPGNHEYYGTVLEHELEAMRARAAHGPVHLLDGDELQMAGVRFLGCTLWTDFRLRLRSDEPDAPPSLQAADPARAMGAAARTLNEYRSIRCEAPGLDEAPLIRALRPADTADRHRRDRQWLLSRLRMPFRGPTVVVTHHAPHRGSLSEDFASDWVSPAFVNELPDACFQGAALWVHGHTHRSFDYRVGPCRVISNPRGYVRGSGESENEAFNDALVISV